MILHSVRNIWHLDCKYIMHIATLKTAINRAIQVLPFYSWGMELKRWETVLSLSQVIMRLHLEQHDLIFITRNRDRKWRFTEINRLTKSYAWKFALLVDNCALYPHQASGRNALKTSYLLCPRFIVYISNRNLERARDVDIRARGTTLPVHKWELADIHLLPLYFASGSLPSCTQSWSIPTGRCITLTWRFMQKHWGQQNNISLPGR